MAMGAVWITAGLAGFSLSVLRAAVAVSLYLAGRWLGRRSDGLTSLAAAALVYFAYNGQRGKPVNKWIFYAAYPVHLGILAALRAILNS